MCLHFIVEQSITSCHDINCCLIFLQELREIHNKQQLQKQKSMEAERLKLKEQERKVIELEKQKEEAQR